jgi:hypothetical protein
MSGQQGNTYREFLYRVGCFFILIGIGLVVLFFASEITQEPIFSYFCWGLVLLFVGYRLRMNYRKSSPSSGRFGLVQRLMPKKKNDKDKG